VDGVSALDSPRLCRPARRTATNTSPFEYVHCASSIRAAIGEVLPAQERRPLGRAPLLSAVWAQFVAFDATGPDCETLVVLVAAARCACRNRLALLTSGSDLGR
jgi:hypothetical protein